MGYAIARRAKKRGANVTLISGPTNIEIPKVDNFVRIKTTQDMFDQVGKYFDNADVLIKAAAPADYKPKYYSKEKPAPSLTILLTTIISKFFEFNFSLAYS